MDSLELGEQFLHKPEVAAGEAHGRGNGLNDVEISMVEFDPWSLGEKIDTGSASGKLQFHVFAALNECPSSI